MRPQFNIANACLGGSATLQSTPEWPDGLLTPRGATLNTKPGARGCSSSLSQDASALGAGRMEVNSGPSGTAVAAAVEGQSTNGPFYLHMRYFLA